VRGADDHMRDPVRHAQVVAALSVARVRDDLVDRDVLALGRLLHTLVGLQAPRDLARPLLGQKLDGHCWGPFVVSTVHRSGPPVDEMDDTWARPAARGPLDGASAGLAAGVTRRPLSWNPELFSTGPAWAQRGRGGPGEAGRGPVLGPARTEAAGVRPDDVSVRDGSIVDAGPFERNGGDPGESTAPAPSGRVAGKGSVGTMREAVIVEAVRTPLGKRGGRLESWHPVDLLGATLSELVSRSGIDPSVVDDVIGGCVSQVGEQTFNVTRNAWLAAGLPEEVP